MFEDLLTPPARFIVGETYKCRGQEYYIIPPFFHNVFVEKRTNKTVWVRYAGEPERLRQKRLKWDDDGNEYIEEYVQVFMEKWTIISTDKEKN